MMYDFPFSIFFTDASFKTFHTDEPYEYAIQRESCEIIIKALGKVGGYEHYTSRLMKALIKNDFTFLNPWSEINEGI